ncbi:hypothetical protein J0895_24325 [Phormidium pseudopriestleyi FRX01]|uniref:Uncharacterized protein n=1 Tax=Phormidium pseudopriestleyi FRX01 TaxID=1759528 RepID=A0ABS3FZV0_9CYAN|nr:hypothetical protein [Phormidium pseudopriestleyi]MBO0352151.1 hypothetical protein [Phormidium pseudopriestleyi FRX01]
MKFTTLFNSKNPGLLGAVFSSLLLGAVAFPVAGIAQNTPTEQNELQAQAQPMPLPQNVQMPVAYVLPGNAPVAVEIINRTNTSITYEAIGETRDRTLVGGDEAMLMNLQIPLTVTFERPDGGLIQARPEIIAPGQIRIYLDEANNLDSDISNMRIDLNGSMYLY